MYGVFENRKLAALVLVVPVLMLISVKLMLDDLIKGFDLERKKNIGKEQLH